MKAPWHDYTGNEIHDGDVIIHPLGDQGTVIFRAEGIEPSDQWFVLYSDTLLRLCLQVGDKGMGVVKKDGVQAAPLDGMPYCIVRTYSEGRREMTELLKVGDKAWYAKCNWEPIRQLCPTCFGKKEVTLILGNSGRVVLPCGGCSHGFGIPTGFMSEYDYVVEPELIIITGIDIEIDGENKRVRYHSCSYSFDAIDIFLTEEEARIKAEEKKKKLDEEQRTRAEHIKKDVHKKFSWNAHYHMREAKRLREDALRHDEKAKLCTAKISKEEI